MYSFFHYISTKSIHLMRLRLQPLGRSRNFCLVSPLFQQCANSHLFYARGLHVCFLQPFVVISVIFFSVFSELILFFTGISANRIENSHKSYPLSLEFPIDSPGVWFHFSICISGLSRTIAGFWPSIARGDDDFAPAPCTQILNSLSCHNINLFSCISITMRCLN